MTGRWTSHLYRHHHTSNLTENAQAASTVGHPSEVSHRKHVGRPQRCPTGNTSDALKHLAESTVVITLDASAKTLHYDFTDPRRKKRTHSRRPPKKSCRSRLFFVCRELPFLAGHNTALTFFGGAHLSPVFQVLISWRPHALSQAHSAASFCFVLTTLNK